MSISVPNNVGRIPRPSTHSGLRGSSSSSKGRLSTSSNAGMSSNTNTNRLGNLLDNNKGGGDGGGNSAFSFLVGGAGGNGCGTKMAMGTRLPPPPRPSTNSASLRPSRTPVSMGRSNSIATASSLSSPFSSSSSTFAQKKRLGSGRSGGVEKDLDVGKERPSSNLRVREDSSALGSVFKSQQLQKELSSGDDMSRRQQNLVKPGSHKFNPSSWGFASSSGPVPEAENQTDSNGDLIPQAVDSDTSFEAIDISRPATGGVVGGVVKTNGHHDGGTCESSSSASSSTGDAFHHQPLQQQQLPLRPSTVEAMDCERESHRKNYDQLWRKFKTMQSRTEYLEDQIHFLEHEFIEGILLCESTQRMVLLFRQQAEFSVFAGSAHREMAEIAIRATKEAEELRSQLNELQNPGNTQRQQEEAALRPVKDSDLLRALKAAEQRVSELQNGGPSTTSDISKSSYIPLTPSLKVVSSYQSITPATPSSSNRVRPTQSAPIMKDHNTASTIAVSGGEIESLNSLRERLTASRRGKRGTKASPCLSTPKAIGNKQGGGKSLLE